MIESHTLDHLEYLAADISTKECRRSFTDCYSNVLMICKKMVEGKQAEKFEVSSSSELLYRGHTLRITKIDDLEEIKNYTAIAFKLACSSSEENSSDRIITKATESIHEYIKRTHHDLNKKINLLKEEKTALIPEDIFASTIRNGNLMIGIFKLEEGERHPVFRKICLDNPEFRIESQLLERCERFLYGKESSRVKVIQEPFNQMLICQDQFCLMLDNRFGTTNFQIIDTGTIRLEGERHVLPEGHFSDALSRYYSSIKALVLVYETFSVLPKENALWLNTLDKEFIKTSHKAIRKRVHTLLISKGFKIKKIKQVTLSPDRSASVMSHRGRISRLSLMDEELDLLALNQVYRRILKLKWEQEKEPPPRRRASLSST